MAIYEAQCSAVGSFGYAQYFKLYVELTEVDVSIENNTSKIQYNVYCKSSGSGSISANHFKYFNMNGQSFINTTEKVNVSSPNAYIPIASGTTGAIAHSADGSKQVGFSAEIKASSYGVSASLSGVFTLSTIARASQPTLSNGSPSINSPITIYTNRASTSFTHNVYCVWGNKTVTVETGVGDSCIFTIPKNFADNIPNSLSGTGTFWVDTYSGSTLIGTKSVTFTASIPDTTEFKPSISSVALSEAVSGLATQFGCYVQNKSKLSGAVTASGAYSSTITSYKITINGATYTSKTFTTGALTTSGSNSYSVTVTDSRNRTATHNGTFTVVAYSNPKISAFTVVRCNSDGTENEEGEYAKVVLAGSIASANSKNTYSYRLQYKKSTATSYTDYSITNDAYSISKTITGIAVDVDSSYDFMLTIQDYFSTVSKEISLETAFTLLNWNKSGKGFAIGKVSEKDAFEVDMDTDLNGDCNVSGEIRKNSRIAKLYQGLVEASNISSFNDALTTGIYDVHGNATDGPVSSAYGYLDVQVANGNAWNKNNNWIWQTFYQTDGTIYQRSATNESAFTTWQRVYKTTSLYDDSAGTTETVILSETSANFSYLEIFFKTNDDIHGSVKVHAPNGKTVNLMAIHPNHNNTAFLKSKTIKIGEASITNVSYSELGLSNSGVNFSNGNTIYITEVVGYR